MVELVLDEPQQVVDMEHVTDLAALATEAHVLELAAVEMPGGPEGDHPLVDLAHLPRTSQHATPVDHRADAVHLPVLPQ